MVSIAYFLFIHKRKMLINILSLFISLIGIAIYIIHDFFGYNTPFFIPLFAFLTFSNIFFTKMPKDKEIEYSKNHSIKVCIASIIVYFLIFIYSLDLQLLFFAITKPIFFILMFLLFILSFIFNTLNLIFSISEKKNR